MLNNKKRFIFRRYEQKYFDLVSSWFDWDCFFYHTTNPKYILPTEIERILNLETNRFIIELEGEYIGICDYNFPNIKSKCCIVEIAFGSTEYWEKYSNHSFLSIIHFIVTNIDVNKISKRVFEFDKKGIILCEKTGFHLEGGYKQLFYKNGKYWDELIFSLSKINLNNLCSVKVEFD